MLWALQVELKRSTLHLLTTPIDIQGISVRLHNIAAFWKGGQTVIHLSPKDILP